MYNLIQFGTEKAAKPKLPYLPSQIVYKYCSMCSYFFIIQHLMTTDDTWSRTKKNYETQDELEQANHVCFFNSAIKCHE